MKPITSLTIVVGTMLLCMCILLLSLANAATPIPLPTAAGVCQFQADSYTTSPLSARGAFGPGCPGYVAPAPVPVDSGSPGNCPAPIYAQRQATINTKFGTGSAVPRSTGDQIFAVNAATAATAFPWAGNRSVTLAINAYQYAAIPIMVPANLPSTFAGRFGFFDTNYLGSPPFPGNNGALYSVSPCPGDFSASLPAACRKQWTGADGDYLTVVGPGVPPAGLCPITPGKTYYLNIVNGALAAPSGNTCAGATCAVSMAYFRLQ